MEILRYEYSLEGLVDREEHTIFLAGPTVRGNQPHLNSWRWSAIEEFDKQGFKGTLVIPEFSDKLESDKGKLWIPKWEYAGLMGVDVIMFWIPRTKELIGLTTNHEHGYWLGRCYKKMVYGRPNDAYRMSYLDVMWEMCTQTFYKHPHPIFDTLEKTVAASIAQATFVHRFYREQSNITVDSPYGKF